MDTAPAQTEILTIIFIGIFLMLLLALAFVLFFYFSQRKFQSQQMTAQEREIEHRDQLLRTSIKTQEEERQRLARELHDEVGSKLNVMNLGLHRLKKQASSPETQQGIQDLLGLMKTTSDNTRRIAHDLLPPTLEKFGLSVALGELCDQFQQLQDAEITYEEANTTDKLDLLVALSFYRVAQELLSNMAKYSQASQVELALTLEPEMIRLSYKDDGIGFDTNDPERLRGLGLQNIESRMRAIKASFQLKSTPGQGTVFNAEKRIL
jgi:signal transduction histidine kinase